MSKTKRLTKKQRLKIEEELANTIQKQRNRIIIRNTYKKFGSASSNFIKDNDELDYRNQVHSELLTRIESHLSVYKLMDWEHFRVKAERLSRLAARYRLCGFEYTKLKCEDCSRYYIAPSRCETRICFSCSKKYSYRIYQKQDQLIRRLQSKKYKRLMFLTLTLKVNPHRPPTGSDLKQAFKYARKLINKLYPKKHGCGAFAVLEIGDNNNIHIHAIVYGRFVPKEAISKLWLKITGDSKIIKIKQVYSPRGCMNYLLKYVTKYPEFRDPEKDANYLDALIGVRRIHTYGIFYNYPFFKKETCPCFFCDGRLRYAGTDGGLGIPLTAMTFEQARNIADGEIN